MPKQRTHAGSKKRFRVTKNGKVLHHRQNNNHMNEHKPSQRQRRLQGTAELTGGDKRQIARLLRRR